MNEAKMAFSLLMIAKKATQRFIYRKAGIFHISYSCNFL